MIILDYQKKYHKQIVRSCVAALRAGKVIVYPTDTCYGLAVDALNTAAVKKLYKIKERDFKKPLHVVVPSLLYAQRISHWNSVASLLVKKFWPGPLTLVLPLAIKNETLKILSAGTRTVGLRMPDNALALDLAQVLKKPITATSANPSFILSGGYESYSAQDVVKQFKNKKFQPDIVINAGKLAKKKPSTVVKVFEDHVDVLRAGPITKKQINLIVGKLK